MKLLFLCTMLVLTVGGVSASPKQSSAKTHPINVARERVTTTLKDPDSAKFRGEFVGKDGAVCGFVNAKNSYGGYGGFERYIVTSDRVLMDGDKAWAMDSRWDELCADYEARSAG